MAETKTIPTQTTINVTNSTVVNIRTFYVMSDQIVVSAFISQTENVDGELWNGVLFTEGQGGIQSDDSANVSFHLDENTGSLIITSDDNDSYSVDDTNGQLVYTY